MKMELYAGKLGTEKTGLWRSEILNCEAPTGMLATEPGKYFTPPGIETFNNSPLRVLPVTFWIFTINCALSQTLTTVGTVWEITTLPLCEKAVYEKEHNKDKKKKNTFAGRICKFFFIIIGLRNVTICFTHYCDAEIVSAIEKGWNIYALDVALDMLIHEK